MFLTAAPRRSLPKSFHTSFPLIGRAETDGDKLPSAATHDNVHATPPSIISLISKVQLRANRIKFETQLNILTCHFFPVRMKMTVYISHYRPNSGLHPRPRRAAVPVLHGIFIPEGATNLKFVLLGLSSHNAVQLSLCSLDSAGV